MYEIIMVSLYGLAALVKNKILAIILLLAGIGYILLNNYFPIDILQSIDINSLMILFGTYGMSKVLIKTNILNYFINLIVDRVGTYKKLIFSLCIFTFIISGVINNYVLIAFLVPCIEEIIKKNNIKYTLLMESIILSSLLGSMSTLIGSTENIIISSYLGMNFLDFFFYDSRIGIFIIFLSLFCIELFIINLSIKDEEFMGNAIDVEIKDKFNIYLFLVMVVLLILSSILNIKYLGGIVSILCLIIGIYKNKKLEKFDFTSIILYALMFMYIFLFKKMNFISIIPIYVNSSWLIYTIFLVVSFILALIFNPVFVFYFICLFIPYIVFNTNLISMPLIYITYFGSMLGYFKGKKINNYYIIVMLLFVYLIISFLYF